MGVPAVKFCGLTRPEDAALAGELAAGYVGVVFAGGPRQVSAERAVAVLDAAGDGPLRVGVFGNHPVPEIAEIAREARLDVVQLHGDPTPGQVATVRASTRCQVWAAVRVKKGELPGSMENLRSVADAVVLDAKVAGQLGGTGTPLDWMALAPSLARQSGAPVVLAGGLTAANVAHAIAAVAPAVVDVSSGVELSPGVKDHARMRAFANAVRKATR